MEGLKDIYNDPQITGGLGAAIICAIIAWGTSFSNEILIDIEIRVIIVIIVGISVYLLLGIKKDRY